MAVSAWVHNSFLYTKSTIYMLGKVNQKFKKSFKKNGKYIVIHFTA